MREFLKKLVNRGAPKRVPFLLLLTVVGVLSLARARPADASTAKAKSSELFCYDDLHNGKFKKFIAKYNKKLPKGSKASFHCSSRYVYARTNHPSKYKIKKYDLKKHVVEGNANTPYRYWFWVEWTRHYQSGKHDNPVLPVNKKYGSIATWRTLDFAVTMQPIDYKNHSVMQHKGKGDYTRLTRLV